MTNHDVLKQTREALALANSMIRGGEAHSVESEQQIQKALDLSREALSEHEDDGDSVKADIFFDSMTEPSDEEVQRVATNHPGQHGAALAAVLEDLREPDNWEETEYFMDGVGTFNTWVWCGSGNPVEMLAAAIDSGEIDTARRALAAQPAPQPGGALRPPTPGSGVVSGVAPAVGDTGRTEPPQWFKHLYGSYLTGDPIPPINEPEDDPYGPVDLTDVEPDRLRDVDSGDSEKC